MRSREPKRIPLSDCEEGVAGVVGAMLLSVILVLLLALVHREYVPAWVKENEAQHMHQVDNDFALFKANLDNQILSGNSNLTLYSPFELGTDGVPFFAQPSPGALQLNDFQNTMVITTSDSTVNLTASGNVHYQAFNREFQDQQLAYEFGGLVKNQTRGDSLMVTAPTFTITNTSNVVNLTLTVVSLTGDSHGVNGLNSEGVHSTLKLYQSDGFAWAGGVTFTLVVTTDFPQAWQTYFSSTLSAQLGATAYSVTRSGSTVTVTINDLNKLDLSLATLEVSLNL